MHVAKFIYFAVAKSVKNIYGKVTVLIKLKVNYQQLKMSAL